ncbi:MAG TPA: hypothetical protein VGA58_02475 [bacterium]
MGRNNQVYTEITIRLFDQPSEFALRGRSTKAVVAALVRGAPAHGPWLRQVARWVEELSHDGWRYRGYTGDALLFRSVKPLDENEATAYVRRRLGQDALERVSVREAAEPASRNGRPPKLPKADDEFTRELRRLIGPEQHKDELYLGHPPEELAELLLDMSFLSQEALEDSEISGLIDQLREEHEHDAQHRDLHSRYLTLMERAGPGDPAAEEAYWDLFSYMSRKLSKLVPALRQFLDRRGFSDLCEHEATAFLTAALAAALAYIEERGEE